MASVSDIKWGKYKSYEGPYYPGKCQFCCEYPGEIANQYLAVITATEGGHYDAVNMYDRMIISVGLIQWGEAGIFAMSALLGAVKERNEYLFEPVQQVCQNANVTLRKYDNLAGPNKWRFVTSDGEMIDTVQEQQKLFLLNSTGAMGSWSQEDKAYANMWAAAVATMFENKDAQQIQAEFTTQRLMGFVLPEVKNLLFAGKPVNNCHAAARAAYLSFAANLPAVAGKHYLKHRIDCGDQEWGHDRLVGMLRELTFGPGIGIYPARYNAIRPVLELLYSIDLPDFADDMKKQQSYKPVELQQLLIRQGYDLGPKGADGVIGAKTQAAIRDFQQRSGLKADGVVNQALYELLAR
jgi:hypothetical protein